MPGNSVLLTDEDRALLLKVSSLLEEIIETLDILENEDTMKSIKQAEEDVKAGRVRGYNEFLKELKRSGEIQPKPPEASKKTSVSSIPS